MKKVLKENYKFIISLILIIFIFTINFPYYIDAPGGITDMNKKIEIDGYKSKGSLNLVYVREYKAIIPTMLISLFNKDWKLIKQDEVLLDTEDVESYMLRDKILMEESNSNAIYVAYKKANKKIEVTSNKFVIPYITKDSSTNLLVGDEIISINNNKITKKEDITNIVNSLNFGDKLSLKVKNNKKEYERYAYVINDNGSKKIGILVSNIKDYKTSPNVKINVDKNESGSSGGLITALSIYNSLTKKDITNGFKIVGTGTIELDGSIGSIGGVEYKLKSAVKNKADIFIVPNDENYEEAIKEKQKYSYDIEIKGVSTFDEVIEYLNKKG